MAKYKTAILYTILIILGFIFALSRVQPCVVQIIDIEKNIGSQTSQVNDAKQQLDTLKKTQAEKESALQASAKNIFKPEITGSNPETSFALFFDDIINMAKYNGVKIYSIQYTYNPDDDEFVKGAPDKFNVCQVNASVISDYVDLEGFLKELYKYPYLINLDSIEIMPYPKNKKILLVDLQLKLYSYK